MKHYRIYKLDQATDAIVRARSIEAADDAAAMTFAEADADCPTCEIWQGARKVGRVE